MGHDEDRIKAALTYKAVCFLGNISYETWFQETGVLQKNFRESIDDAGEDLWAVEKLEEIFWRKGL